MMEDLHAERASLVPVLIISLLELMMSEEEVVDAPGCHRCIVGPLDQPKEGLVVLQVITRLADPAAWCPLKARAPIRAHASKVGCA